LIELGLAHVDRQADETAHAALAICAHALGGTCFSGHETSYAIGDKGNAFEPEGNI
jgi:hypothetical protein